MVGDIVPRQYQSEAIYGGKGFPGIYKALREHDSTVLVMATGTGKTIVFSKVVEACVSRGKRALVVAHRQELISQAYQKLTSTTSVDRLSVGVEMGHDRSGDHHSVVVGSVQTLQGSRLSRFDSSGFGLVVIDEAHHAVAKSYAGLIDHFDGAKLLGVTATPDRLDGKGLRKVFASTAYCYEIADAVADGYLVPITGQVVFDDEIDLSAVRTVAGDFNQGDLAEVMTRQPALALVAKGIVDLSGGRTTMGFTVSVNQAKAVAEYLNTLEPGSSRWVDGRASREERGEILNWLIGGPGRRVINCALYTEGIDVPEVSCIAVARPTKSRSLYAQMVGRGTRLLGSTMEESVAAGKTDMLVLDFSGASGRHKLVSCLDILDGNEDAVVRGKALERAKAGPVHIQRVLDEVAAEIVAEQREKALEQASYRAVVMADPFAILGVRPRAGRQGGRPATVGQLERLSRHKIPGASKALKALESGKKVKVGIDYWQAQETLRAIAERASRDLCSVRQAKILIRYGLNPDATFNEARSVIDRINAARWRPSPHLIGELKKMPGMTQSAS